MPISVTCPSGHRLTVKSALAGRTAKCPKCGGRLEIPAESPPGPGDSAMADIQSPAAAYSNEEWDGLDDGGFGEPPDDGVEPPRRPERTRSRSASPAVDPALPWKIASGLLAATTLVFATLYFSAPAVVPVLPAGAVAAAPRPPANDNAGEPAPDSPAAAVPASPAQEGTPREAARAAADALEEDDFVAFFRDVMADFRPVFGRVMTDRELIRMSRQSMSVEDLVVRMAEDPKELEKMRQLADVFRRCAATEPEIKAGVLAVFRVPAEPLDDAPESLPVSPESVVAEGRLPGYGNDAMTRAAADLKAGEFENFVLKMFPEAEAVRLSKDAAAMAAVVFSLKDRPDAVAAMVRDFEYVAQQPDPGGDEAAYTIPGDLAGGEDRRVVFQKGSDGSRRMYDAASDRRREIGRLAANYEPPPPPMLEVPFVKGEGKWRLRSLDFAKDIPR